MVMSRNLAWSYLCLIAERHYSPNAALIKRDVRCRSGHAGKLKGEG